jgi:hypothetical protein
MRGFETVSSPPGSDKTSFKESGKFLFVLEINEVSLCHATFHSDTLQMSSCSVNENGLSIGCCRVPGGVVHCTFVTKHQGNVGSSQSSLARIDMLCLRQAHCGPESFPLLP